MNEPKDWLEEDEDEQEDANNWMRLAYQISFVRDIYANTECRDVQQVGESLQNAVHQPKAREVSYANEDGADREEEAKG